MDVAGGGLVAGGIYLLLLLLAQFKVLVVPSSWPCSSWPCQAARRPRRPSAPAQPRPLAAIGHDPDRAARAHRAHRAWSGSRSPPGSRTCSGSRAQGIQDVRNWLATRPLHVTGDQINTWIDQAQKSMRLEQQPAGQRRARGGLHRRGRRQRAVHRPVQHLLLPLRRKDHLGVRRRPLPAGRPAAGRGRRRPRLGHADRVRAGHGDRRRRRRHRHRPRRGDPRRCRWRCRSPCWCSSARSCRSSVPW